MKRSEIICLVCCAVVFVFGYVSGRIDQSKPVCNPAHFMRVYQA